MLLPALRNGYAKAQRLYCVNNLHQTGLAFHSFAHSHQDRFPMQVSTNDGGSLEFLQAGNTTTSEFYYSYRHFSPLSNDLGTPKILGCPTDTRRPATNFAILQNENLSYFAAGNPEFGSSDSVLAGNRNVSPVFGSVATVGNYRRLRWTEELHRFKGNVLFSDGHVDQLNDVFSVTNRGVTAALTSLHLPTLKPDAALAGGNGGSGGGYDYAGGSGAAAPRVPGVPPMFTNRLGSNEPVITWTVSGPSLKGRWLGAPGGNSADAGGVSPPPDPRPSPPLARAASANPRVAAPEVDPWSLKEVSQRAIAKGQAMLRRAALGFYDIPWYLLLLLIAALFELRRRLRARQRTVVRHPIVSGTR
jgi:prepilin-type processing-associated H-X9-DG protein